MEYNDESDSGRFEKLSDKFSETYITLQLGVSILKSDNIAKRQYLLNELNNVIKDLALSNGFEQALIAASSTDTEEIPDLGFILPNRIKSFKRVFIESTNKKGLPIMAFVVEFAGISKVLLRRDLEVHVQRLRPNSTLGDYVFIDTLDFYEIIVLYLLINQILSYLTPPKIKNDKFQKFQELFYDQDNWEILKNILKTKGYIDDNHNWICQSGNKSDLAVLCNLLRDYNLIHAPHVAPAAKLLYKEFGLDTGDGEYISSRMFYKELSEKNQDKKEFDQIIRYLTGLG